MFVVMLLCKSTVAYLRLASLFGCVLFCFDLRQYRRSMLFFVPTVLVIEVGPGLLFELCFQI